ncbi:trypsin-like serine peptidase [Tautonia plasticadhaerens]|uniref:trypsin-like serine peptidase n=1 Tax=Tautonia plasticadhaerens TaxID=2527974 RepID=UPI0018D23C9E|nr:trypsin-like peptidase domain-containing protein [Tautonia plasticadhaerens]
MSDTSRYPYCTVCALHFLGADGKRRVGTGTLIGRRTILTAGHNVYVPELRRFNSDFQVLVGLNFSAQPFTVSQIHAIDADPAWKARRDQLDRSHDLGVILLQDQVADLSTNQPLEAAMGFNNYSDADLINERVDIAGYPADASQLPPNAGPEWQPGTSMWRSFSQVPANGLDASFLSYVADTQGGQSGSPVFRYFRGATAADDRSILVGVHTHYAPALKMNRATRINPEVRALLIQWLGVVG